MRVVCNELKKIWNWKILGVLVIVCVLFYIMFMSYHVEYYRGNHEQAESIYYAEELVRLYGTSVTPEEFSDYITKERDRLISEAETYIQTLPVFAQAGIYSYADYETFQEREKEPSQADWDAYWTLLDEEYGYLGFFIQTLASMEEYFDSEPIFIDDPGSFWATLNEKEQTRYKEIVQNGEIYSIFNFWTYDNTNDYAVRLAILLMLSTLILVSPLLASDRHSNVHHLHYSSKLGRKIIHRQLIAMLFSAFMLATLLISIFGGIYSANGTYLFWNCNINSSLNIGHYSVFNLTYGQWVTAMVILMYVLALGVSMLAFMLSRFSRNLITMMMKLIPVFAATAFLCIFAFNGLFQFYNALYKSLRIFGTEAYVCGAVVIIGFTATLIVMQREKRVDVA